MQTKLYTYNDLYIKSLNSLTKLLLYIYLI